MARTTVTTRASHLNRFMLLSLFLKESYMTGVDVSNCPTSESIIFTASSTAAHTGSLNPICMPMSSSPVIILAGSQPTIKAVLQKPTGEHDGREASLPVQLSTTVTLSQEHSLSDGFSGSVFDKSPQSDNGPLEPSHLLSVTVVLDRHSKQAGDERNLTGDVPFFHTMHLPLPNHVHPLISL